MLAVKCDYHEILCDEFDRQAENLVCKSYPAIAGMEPVAFLRQLEPLKERMAELAAQEPEPAPGRIPFVIVVKRELVAGEIAMSRVALKGKTGLTVIEANDLKRFTPIAGLSIPGAPAYLLLDVDTGKDTLNVTPDAAMPILERSNRSPLTIDEGIALVTQYPEILRTHNCFSLLGSRCGDRRVAALWVSAGRPKLGWCWAGNPHTWLGSASCAGRVGP